MGGAPAVPRAVPFLDRWRRSRGLERRNVMPNASDGTPYSITLTMSPKTQAALATGGWNLYAFKGVKTSDGAAVPLVWFQVPATEILTSNIISWTEQYQAYVSDQTFVPEGAIDSSNSISISLDQTCNVD
jgi:hypothetical protein